MYRTAFPDMVGGGTLSEELDAMNITELAAEAVQVEDVSDAPTQRSTSVRSSPRRMRRET